jgi:hypothetical protein
LAATAHSTYLPPERGGWCFHDLRHTAATLMLADGVPLMTVSKILGHSLSAVTAQIYAHALDESKADAIAGRSQKLRRDPARITHTIHMGPIDLKAGVQNHACSAQ